MIGWIIAGVVVVGLAVAGGIGWSYLTREHREARGLPLDAVDFTKLQDGIYRGAYAGGMYKWRANECQVTVADGKVTGIELVGSQDPGGGNTPHQVLYDRVVAEQSLQVDTISGATLTSKAYLQAVENALIQAQRD
jgi:uncharacterized protein with FMN-binding domain